MHFFLACFLIFAKRTTSLLRLIPPHFRGGVGGVVDSDPRSYRFDRFRKEGSGKIWGGWVGGGLTLIDWYSKKFWQFKKQCFKIKVLREKVVSSEFHITYRRQTTKSILQQKDNKIFSLCGNKSWGNCLLCNVHKLHELLRFITQKYCLHRKKCSTYYQDLDCVLVIFTFLFKVWLGIS